MRSFLIGAIVGLITLVAFVLLLAPIILASLFSWMYLLGYVLIIPLLMGFVGLLYKW